MKIQMKFLFIIMLTFSFPVVAQGVNGGGETKAVCDALTKYKKINDAAYVPGVDVNGNAVVPADINNPTIIKNITKVPLTINLANRLRSLQGAGVEMQANLGMLEIHEDGRVMLNDQDLTSDVKTVCGIAHEKKEVVEVTSTEQAVPPQETPIDPIEPEVTTKIITHKPELVPELLQGQAYRD
jgi:hypothetical protein